MMLAACPNCDSSSIRSFYQVDGIPCHSVLLMRSRTEALEYPRGELDLHYCENCTFIFNALFDVSANDYSPDYEETQHYSPRFNQFCDQLIHQLVEEYGIQNRRVLEIGCGKGEFLGRLCDAGQNTGIGFDPSCRPERLPSEQQTRIEFVQRLFTEDDETYGADLVCCRHTLEHIQPTRQFLNAIRKSIGARLETLVFFEVPDIDIILRESRYWDLYYEHCSYFSETSLVHLFEACGFEVIEVKRDFDDQYLLIFAKPVDFSVAKSGSLAIQKQTTARLLTSFEERYRKEFAAWKNWFHEQQQHNRSVAIWGAGSKCVSFLTTNGISEEVQGVVDINPNKQGQYLPGTGHRVDAPESLAVMQPDTVIVMNAIYTDEIVQALRSMNVQSEIKSL